MKGSSEAKKPKEALVAIAFGAPRSKPKDGAASSSRELDSSEDDGHAAAFDAFANAVGIPAERRAKAREALKSYVRQCMAEGDADDDY